MVRKRGSRPNLIVMNNYDGTVTVSANHHKEVVNINKMAPWEKIEALRWAIMRAGVVWTDDAEKITRKALNL